MSDFLNFLNIADHDTLIKISGISNTLAEKIIAARPFDSTDDLLLIQGVGKNLLARMQTFAEAQENIPESGVMIPVEEEAIPAPIEMGQPVQELPVGEEAMPALIEKSQPTQEAPVEKKPSFGSRLGQAFLSFIRALFRLIATLLVIFGIGAAIYFGVPYITNTFIVPMERNTANIRQLENEVATLQTQLDEMNTHVGAIETTMETQTASIVKLGEMQSRLEKEISNQNNGVMVALKREIMLTRAIETIARGRLFLSQSNFGLAHDDVKATRDILAELLTDAPAYQVNALNQIITRLDFALSNLPAFPVIAVNDVDIAWQLLIRGLPESESDVVATFTPSPPPATPTPDSISTVTPTTTIVPSATAPTSTP